MLYEYTLTAPREDFYNITPQVREAVTKSGDNPIEADGKTVKRFEYVDEADKQDELTEAHRALSSTLQKCEKIDLDKQGKSQRTLLERRITALKTALRLIEKEQESNA